MLELVSQYEDEIRDMVKTILLHREILDAYFKFSVTKNGQIGVLAHGDKRLCATTG